MVLDRLRRHVAKNMEGFADALAQAAADPSVRSPVKNEATVASLMAATAYAKRVAGDIAGGRKAEEAGND